MRCVACSSLDTAVINTFKESNKSTTRLAKTSKGAVVRTRHCRACGHKFETIEIPTDRMDDYDLELKVKTLTKKLHDIRKLSEA